MQARMIGETEGTQLLHVTCRKCQNSILALVLQNASGVSSVGLVTDLTFEDVGRFQRARSISVDDVIDLHAFLEEGGWRNLYQAPARKPVRKRAVKKVLKSAKSPKTK